MNKFNSKSTILLQKQSNSNINRSKSPTKQKIQENLPSRKQSKTASIPQIQQLAQKHYTQAMKWVYRKNKAQQQVKARQIAKLKKEDEKLTIQHTFKPNLFKSKYSVKPKQQKSPKKQTQLQKWGKNHSTLRRETILQDHAKTMRNLIQRNHRSLQAASLSVSRSKQSRQKSINNSMYKTNRLKTQQIPGVHKYYLNKARAEVLKTKKEKLLFKGNQIEGYYF